MNRNLCLSRAWILLCGLSFGVPTTAPGAPGAETPDSEGTPASGIVAHPSELAFPDLDFTPPDSRKHRHVLPCGVVVYVVEDPELPLVDVQVLVRTGPYLDPPGKYGLASMVSSQLRKGGTLEQTPEEFDEELAFLAAQVSTSLQDTRGTAALNCLTKDLDRVLELFFDMLGTPRFDAARLELERNQDLQEMARRNDQTSSIEAREWERLLRGEGFYTTLRSTRASLESISRDDLVSFHERYYHPGNFLVAVSGDVTTERILEMLEGHLEDWPGDPEDREEAPLPPGTSYEPEPGVYLVDKSDVNQGRVSLGHLSTTRDNPDYPSLLIMNQILGGGGFTSRITERVRSDKGLAYSARSSFEFGIYIPGDFRASFQSKSESVIEAVSLVLEEIRKVRQERVSTEELETAVNYAVGIFPRFFATPMIVARTFASDEFTGRKPDFWRTYREKISAVTLADVQRVAAEYLHPDRLLVLIVGNATDILQGSGETGAEVLEELAGPSGLRRIPLPDPMTLEYPEP